MGVRCQVHEQATADGMIDPSMDKSFLIELSLKSATYYDFESKLSVYCKGSRLLVAYIAECKVQFGDSLIILKILPQVMYYLWV